MIDAAYLDPDLAAALEARRRADLPSAIATVVRTAGATAAKPGAKALLDAEGAILQGWLGGGCTRGAIARAARRALEEGRPQLVSVAPEEDLSARGVAAGEEIGGVAYARNGCPSRGTVDIFVEPVTPAPELALWGGSPVARALADLAPRFGWVVARAEGDIPAPPPGRLRAAVVATQGAGDLAALTAALNAGPAHVGFVGSRLKFSAMAEKLRAAGMDDARIAAVEAPAGLPIQAVTPEEIALSILAGLTRLRRAGRGGAAEAARG